MCRLPFPVFRTAGSGILLQRADARQLLDPPPRAGAPPPCRAGKEVTPCGPPHFFVCFCLFVCLFLLVFIVFLGFSSFCVCFKFFSFWGGWWAAPCHLLLTTVLSKLSKEEVHVFEGVLWGGWGFGAVNNNNNKIMIINILLFVF